jgi:hypothetical protein
MNAMDKEDAQVPAGVEEIADALLLFHQTTTNVDTTKAVTD